MKQIPILAALGIRMVLLAACGHSPAERAATGGLGGAAIAGPAGGTVGAATAG